MTVLVGGAWIHEARWQPIVCHIIHMVPMIATIGQYVPLTAFSEAVVDPRGWAIPNVDGVVLVSDVLTGITVAPAENVKIRLQQGGFDVGNSSNQWIYRQQY